ncbi:dihydroxyacetone kinase family protein [Actinosynnema pretiosum subsp. pretiosum]|uniref:Dihydroxyacetone kinase family protein n=1 Tax=Actinosynnema pretiosum subsp. pretiosum TaxID=103721 RepID=A0AA45L9G9_9PSEU|nr:Dihydroxyacetone kinase, ATP-dependent [Actinosynnema pretiosum subsp. pretiosum]QUF05786.1 dihydroxyacetone kinase family protein [Actinosynnema pretiosum subsp. pretiosum]
MTRLRNDPAEFADQLVDGFVAANATRVRRVPGGVVRVAEGAPGTVAIVTGGGSGHYPAFGGLVGTGMAHGAAMGNVFASPSARQVRSVARAVDNGAGVLFVFGRYAGDVLNFGQAEQRLIADGIPSRTVPVTDDVSVADREDPATRRGLAGGLAVIKLAAAAAEAGLTLEQVASVAERANARTRTIGVAFSGCTLPGASEPLFTVPEGRMAIGMGVHGEPGTEEQDVPSADEMAAILVRKVLEHAPVAGPARAAVLLNGLGAVKYEELFVVYREVARLLAEAGIELVEPEVGEFYTSFDMAGLSLSLVWLDEELEGYWRAPADSPGYRKTPSPAASADPAAGEAAHLDPEEAIPAATDASKAAAKRAAAAIEASRIAIDEAADELGRIDAIAGDGDHGIGMQRGITAAAAAAARAVDEGAGLGTTLRIAGDEWADKAGGTSGALWGVALYAAGSAFGDDEPRDAAKAVAAAVDAILGLGGAEVGDKTMVDALVPYRTAFADAVASGDADPWTTAARAADAAAKATADLKPRMGRARTHVERSLGTPDAGAISFALVVTTVAGVLAAS